MADQGTVLKWSQRPFSPNVDVDGDGVVDPMQGENIPSDIDWRLVADPASPVTEPNWNVADDFRSDGRPILTVRWWGSYFPTVGSPDVGPGVEEGYILSFFSDQPALPVGSFSQPKDLLATYIAPFDAVTVSPTPLVGWDMHQIFQYEVNLQDTHLEHALPDDNGNILADDIAFNEQAGIIYWLSVTAENGHDIVVTTDPVSGEETWTFAPNNDPFPDDHFWGWHTSFDEFNDVATMGKLFMTDTNDWAYDNWEPIQPDHVANNMAFELLTIPEPSSLLLLGIGGLMLLRRQQATH